jgi:hypothetical protein
LTKINSVFTDYKKVQFFQETAKLNDIEEEVDSSSDEIKKNSVVKTKSMQNPAKKKTIEAYDGSASDDEKVNFEDMMKQDPK